jgi:putative mRNA 3-end processing factor
MLQYLLEEPDPLIIATKRGLYCPQGDFFIDPSRPVQTAVITHAHGDHLRHGSVRYILARPGAALARHRLGRRDDITAVDYGIPLQLGATRVSLHPAGHVLGSAQVRIEHQGRVWVVSGDYKRQADPTCAPFESVACDVFVSEATFASPLYQWAPTSQVIEEIAGWWRANRERGLVSALFCYALGKSQRILAELATLCSEPVYVHANVGVLTDLYRKAGIEMLPTEVPRTGARTDYRGALIIAPPGPAGTRWLRRFGAHSSGFCSGWMSQPAAPERRGYDRGFAISDHADWPALVTTCLQSGARRVLFMHGRSEAIARHLNEQGIAAQALPEAPC